MNLKDAFLLLNPYQGYLYLFKTRKFIKYLDRPREVQEQFLKEIIELNKTTKYGIDKKFNKINSIDDFKNKLPICRYDDLSKYLEQTKYGFNGSITNDKTLFFAITSGTTSKPKYIPQNKFTIKSLQTSWGIWTNTTYFQTPKTFSLLGAIHGFSSKSYEGRTKGNLPYGSISALIHDKQLLLIKKMYCVPDEVLLVEDYELRYYLILVFILKKKLTLLVSPNPSNLIILARKLNENYQELIEDFKHNRIKRLIISDKVDLELKTIILNKFQNKGKNYKISLNLEKIKSNKSVIYPKDIFKNLKTIGCWKGGSVGIYIKNLPKYYGENVLIHEIGFMASEGRFNIPVKYSQKGEGVLEIYSNFYEFIEVNDYENKLLKTKLVDELEEGKKYYIIITNRSGLYRYFMDDIVEVVGYYKKTPQIRFVQKGKYVSNITGEKITEWEIIDAANSSLIKNDYHTFFSIVNLNSKTPYYEYHIEFDKNIPDDKIKEIEIKIDAKLQDINIEYKSKRESQRLDCIKIIKLPDNFITKVKMEFSKNNSNDTQIKIPKLIVLEKDKKMLKEMKII